MNIKLTKAAILLNMNFRICSFANGHLTICFNANL